MGTRKWLLLNNTANHGPFLDRFFLTPLRKAERYRGRNLRQVGEIGTFTRKREKKERNDWNISLPCPWLAHEHGIPSPFWSHVRAPVCFRIFLKCKFTGVTRVAAVSELPTKLSRGRRRRHRGRYGAHNDRRPFRLICSRFASRLPRLRDVIPRWSPSRCTRMVYRGEKSDIVGCWLRLRLDFLLPLSRSISGKSPKAHWKIRDWKFTSLQYLLNRERSWKK